MLKSILSLEGAQKLGKNEQKKISGGMLPFGIYPDCCDPEIQCCTPKYISSTCRFELQTPGSPCF